MAAIWITAKESSVPIARSISDAELDVLKALWETGPSTVRALHESLQEQGRSWAYTTVQTLLQRLLQKGYVQADTSGHAHLYSATSSRDDLIGESLGDLASRVCGGSATPLLLNLASGHKFTSEELEQFRKLLDDLESKQKTGARRRKKTDR
jgi:predicted transcriptional regulator